MYKYQNRKPFSVKVSYFVIVRTIHIAHVGSCQQMPSNVNGTLVQVVN